MALLHGSFDFTGSLGDLSAYRMKGCKRTVVRTKGGPSAHRIKNDPKMHMVRRHNSEFGGRSQAMSAVVHVLRPLKSLADFNYSNAVTTMVSYVQPLDTVSALGRRNVLLTKQPQLWVGFSMNESNGFDSLIPAPITCTLSRETMSAQIDIPELIPGVNLNVPAWRPMYCIKAVLGAVPDFLFSENVEDYVPTIGKYSHSVRQAFTDWVPSTAGSSDTSLQLDLRETYDTEKFVLMLAVGISFGAPGPGGMILPMKNAGAAKILACI